METNRDWLVMFQAGVRLVQGLRAKKQRGLYSYNGVVLLDIYKVYTPELQKTYPYAVICALETSSLTSAHLFLSPVRIYHTKSTPLRPFITKENGAVISYYCEVRPDGEVRTDWGRSASYDEELVANQSFSLSAGEYLAWVNTDMLDSDDGTVYLAASDPVPV